MAMGEPAQGSGASLTEREKATLRLLLAGHDAKSIARTLDLSVHTVNERLRDARRKLGVSSSREAARWLAEREEDAPEKLRDMPIRVSGEAPAMASSDSSQRRHHGVHRLAWLSGGMLIMSLVIAAIAAVALHTPATPSAQTPMPSPAASAVHAEGLEAARQWLALTDQAKWEASWQSAGAMFRTQVTSDRWAGMVKPVRGPLGAVSLRSFQSATKTKTLPGAPDGDYEVLKFQTDFAQRSGATETVILAREGTGWRVVGYLIQ